MFVKDIIIRILSIEDISFEKLSEIINAHYGVDVPKKRIYGIYQTNIEWKIYNDINN